MSQLVSAVSVGIVNGTVVADLDYREDSAADVDMNVVGLPDGRLVEVQGSAEGAPFTDEQFQSMLELARDCCRRIHDAQQGALR